MYVIDQVSLLFLLFQVVNRQMNPLLPTNLGDLGSEHAKAGFQDAVCVASVFAPKRQIDHDIGHITRSRDGLECASFSTPF